MKLKNKLGEKGITLVALIVTIIILVILAAVSIWGIEKSGIIEMAIKSTQKYQSEEYKEYSEFEKIGGIFSDFFKRLNGEIVDPEEPSGLPKGWDKDKVIAVESGDGINVPIPIGYELSEVPTERNVRDGLVIKEGNNEYVWIPISNPSEMFTTDLNGNAVGQLYDFGTSSSSKKNPPTKIEYSLTGTREPDTCTNDASTSGINELKSIVGITGNNNNEVIANWKAQLKEEFEAMKASVEVYGGFYIGRYETGNVTKSKAVAEKGNKDIVNASWYTIYQKSKTIAEGTSVSSFMIWGCQYDAIMRWFLDSGDNEIIKYVTDSTGKGYYSGIVPTASDPKYGVKNIYDLAGNAWEWTMEVFATQTRVLRGGASGWTATGTPASCRYGYEYPLVSCGNIGSRCTLVIPTAKEKPSEPEKPDKPVVPDVPSGWDKNKVVSEKSADGIDVPVPKGYTVSDVITERNVKDGFVIKNGVNEYVWIPVTNSSRMFTTDTNGKTVGQLYDFGTSSAPKNPPTGIGYSTSGMREPDSCTNDSSTDGINKLKSIVGITGSNNNEVIANWKAQLEKEFQDMKTSIETYGGFYIGRYETGNLKQEKAVTTKGNKDIVNADWYTMYQKNKTIAEGTGVSSHLIWGCQYDEVMRWLLSSGDSDIIKYVTNSSGKGNYGSTIVETGSSTAYGVKNIYDLAGNAWEWTMEVFATQTRVLRRRGNLLGRNKLSCKLMV